MGMLVANWNLFHKCVQPPSHCGLWQKGFLSCYNQRYAYSLNLQCYLDQDPQPNLMLQKFITFLLLLFTDYCLSLLSVSLIYHLQSGVSSHNFKGENVKTHKDIVGCPRSQRTKELQLRICTGFRSQVSYLTVILGFTPRTSLSKTCYFGHYLRFAYINRDK